MRRTRARPRRRRAGAALAGSSSVRGELDAAALGVDRGARRARARAHWSRVREEREWPRRRASALLPQHGDGHRHRARGRRRRSEPGPGSSGGPCDDGDLGELGDLVRLRASTGRGCVQVDAAVGRCPRPSRPSRYSTPSTCSAAASSSGPCTRRPSGQPLAVRAVRRQRREVLADHELDPAAHRLDAVAGLDVDADRDRDLVVGRRDRRTARSSRAGARRASADRARAACGPASARSGAAGPRAARRRRSRRRPPRCRGVGAGGSAAGTPPGRRRRPGVASASSLEVARRHRAVVPAQLARDALERGRDRLGLGAAAQPAAGSRPSRSATPSTFEIAFARRRCPRRRRRSGSPSRGCARRSAAPRPRRRCRTAPRPPPGRARSARSSSPLASKPSTSFQARPAARLLDLEREASRR